MIKKLLAALLAACLITAVFTSCSKRGEGSSSESDAPSESVSEPESAAVGTPQEVAAANNAKIAAADVSLIQFEEPKPGDTVAVLETTEGTIRIRLFPEQAPKAVENFVGLAREGYYNGLSFHHVVEDFMIQSGDPTSDGTGGNSLFATEEDERGYFENEFSLDLWHFRGAVGMANTGPDTNASQFYIVQRGYVGENTMEEMREIQFPAKVIEKYEEVGGAPNLDWSYTIFGMVLEGMEVVDAISQAEVEDAENKNYKPTEAILVENITIEEVE